MALSQVTAGARILISDLNNYYSLLKGVAGEQITLIYNAASAILIQPSSDPAAGTEAITIKNNAGTRQMAITFDGDLVGTGGILTLPAGADTLVGRATTDTLTNKTLTAPTIADFTNAQHDHGDADDGGAVVVSAHGAATHTDRTRDIFIPAPAWALGGTGSPALSTQTNVSAFFVIAWKLDADAQEAVQTGFLVPADWASGTLAYKIYWAMDTATSGNVVMRIRALARAAGESVDANPDLDQSDTVAVAGTVETLTVTTLGATHTVAAGDMVQIRLDRMGGDASDTATGDLLFIGLEIEYTADM